MKKKISILIAMVIWSSTVLSGCGGKDTATSAKPADTATAPATDTAKENTAPATDQTDASAVEIRAAWWGDTNRHELYNQIIDRFQEENPEITVVREPVSWNDYWDKLTVQSASGGAPDFMGMHPQYASDYLGRGIVEPLDQYVKDGILDISKFSEGAINSGVVNGIQYMVPMGITFSSTFVDESLIEEIGLKPPSFDWTWDDAKAYGLEARKALDAAGKTGSWLIADGTSNFQGFRYFVRQHGRELYSADGNIEFTAEDAEEYFTMWSDWRANGIVPDPATTTEYANATLEDSLFSKGKILVYGVPINQYKLYCTTFPDMKISAIRNPTMAGGKVGELPEGAHFAVSAKTTPEKKVAAVKLMNFWVNSKNSIELFGLDQGMPGNQEMTEVVIPTLDEYQKYILDFATDLTKIATASTFPPTGASEVEAAFKTIAESVIFDTKTPKDASLELVKQAQEIVDKNRQ